MPGCVGAPMARRDIRPIQVFKPQLSAVKAWAQERIKGGSEPPWAWYQYMKLIETVEAILDGVSVTATENSQQSAGHSEKQLRLVDSSDQPDTFQSHRGRSPKVRMPM